MNRPLLSTAERSNIPSGYTSSMERIDVAKKPVSTFRNFADMILQENIDRLYRSIDCVSGIPIGIFDPDREPAFGYQTLIDELQTLIKADQRFVGTDLISDDQESRHPATSGAPANIPSEPELHLHPEREALKEEVRHLLKHACEEDWDGEGAQALSPNTAEIAVGLANTFPAGIDKPMISATPHGEVDFDWSLSRDIMLTVSVGPSGDVAFAGLFYETELNGKEPWKGDLPQFVMCCFERLKCA